MQTALRRSTSRETRGPTASTVSTRPTPPGLGRCACSASLRRTRRPLVQLRSAADALATSSPTTRRKRRRPTCRSGLLMDPQAHGLLEQTLVVWGSEVRSAATGTTRVAGPQSFAVRLFDGSQAASGGTILGATDPVGYAAINVDPSPTTPHPCLGVGSIGSRRHNDRNEMAVNGGEVIHEVAPWVLMELAFRDSISAVLMVVGIGCWVRNIRAISSPRSESHRRGHRGWRTPALAHLTRMLEPYCVVSRA